MIRRWRKTLIMTFALGSLLACDQAEDRSKPAAPADLQAKSVSAIKTWNVAELQALAGKDAPTGEIRLLAWLAYEKAECSKNDCGGACCNTCSGGALASGQPPGAKSLPGLPLLREGRIIQCQTRDCDWPKACPHPPGRYAFLGRLTQHEGKPALEVTAFADPDKKPASAKAPKKRIDPRKAYSQAVHAFAMRGDCNSDVECMMISSIADCDLDDLAIPGRFYTGMPAKQLQFWRKMDREDRAAGRSTLDPRCKQDLRTAYKASCEAGRCRAQELK